MKKFLCVLAAITMLLFVSNAAAFAAQKNEGKMVPVQHAFLVKQGMRGENVKIVQNLLTQQGYAIGEVDGICGPKTVAAIMQFQFTHNLLPDGTVGEATLATMRRAEPVSSRNMRAMLMHASAYSAYDPGNSSYTATGSLLKRGLVAVDPRVIPLGTRLYIPGYGMAVADDTGGAIKGNRIDLAFDSHGEALQFGRREITVYIVD